MVTPKVAIIVLNWNGRDNTIQCLKSIFQSSYSNFYAIVVDNGSSDGSVEAIKSTFSEVHLIKTGKNLGYAGGNNIGIQYAINQGAEFIFILNNDTTIAPDTIKYLIETYINHPQAAALMPVLYVSSNPKVILSAGGSFFEDTLNPVSHKQGETESSLEDIDILETLWCSGAALFTKSKVFQEIGLFDSRFFLVYEEADWCFRARRLGYTCLVSTKAKVWHKVAASFGGESSPLRVYFSTRNKLLFAEKNVSLYLWLALVIQSINRIIPRITIPSMTHRMFFKNLFWALRETIKTFKQPNQVAIRRGLIDYLLRQFGDCPESIRNLNQKN